jgi:hypothetical protein
MTLQITNRNSLNNIVFNSVNDESAYKSISESVTFKIKILTQEPITWLGIRFDIDDNTNRNIFYSNNKRNLYYYPNLPLRNNDVIEITTRFKSTKGLEELAGDSFGNILFGKKSKITNYLKHGLPHLSHPSINTP